MQTYPRQTTRFAPRAGYTLAGFKLSDLAATVAFVAAVAFSIAVIFDLVG